MLQPEFGRAQRPGVAMIQPSTPSTPRLEPLGDCALLVVFGEQIDLAANRRVHALAAALAGQAPRWLLGLVPAYATLAIYYHLTFIDFDGVAAAVAGALGRPGKPHRARRWTVEVRYGGTDGPDLGEVAERLGLTQQEVVDLHCSVAFPVYMLGFAPGFGYLGGLPERLALPRRASPRPLVPAGSVLLGGAQTAVMPLDMPSGWHILGWTPQLRVDWARRTPTGLRAGDTVQFAAVSGTLRRDKRPPRAEPMRTQRARDGQLVVEDPGGLLTVQDGGRPHLRHLGVPVGGAADRTLYRLALMLAHPDAADPLTLQGPALELTAVGPQLRVARGPVRVAVAADAEVRVDGRAQDSFRAWVLETGQTLHVGSLRSGARGYVAVAGLRVPTVQGSASQVRRLGLGPWGGARLEHGHVLACDTDAGSSLELQVPAPAGNGGPLRFVWGPESALVGSAVRDQLTQTVWTVGPDSDRMAVQLLGPPLLSVAAGELVSGPVCTGTIQVSPDGVPRLLGCECQTTGGYPRLGALIGADLDRLGQLRAGEAVRLQPIDLQEASRLTAQHSASLATLRTALRPAFPQSARVLLGLLSR